MNRLSVSLSIMLVLVMLFAGCRNSANGSQERKESREAKALLQGVWLNQDTEEVFFKVQGDTVYYPDTVSLPSYFKIVDDTIYIGTSAGYHISKQSEHLLWFENSNGEAIKLEKQQLDADDVFQRSAPVIQTLTEVLKRDTVVFLEGQRYHCYTAINPTRYKVVSRQLNDDGIMVDQVYYDNIVHVSVFKGSQQVFSRDIRKQQYAKLVPEEFLANAILNDMIYEFSDGEGFHFNAHLCVPNEATSYVIANIVSRDGRLTTKIKEY